MIVCRRFVSMLLVAALAALTFLLIGCNVRLPGLNDVELRYERPAAETTTTTTTESSDTSGKPEKRSPISVENQVDLRMLRARVPVTIAPSGTDGVRVTVDEYYADAAEHALAWRGGLTIYRLDPKHAIPHEQPAKPGLLRVAETTEDETHRLLYDAAASAKEDPLPVAHKKPLFDFGGERTLAEGKNLVISIKGDPAAIERLSNELGDELVAFTRGVSVIWLGRLRDCFTTHHGGSGAAGHAAVVIPRGTDLYAYSRARKDARVLAPPVLSARLKQVERRSLPKNHALAIGCVVFPLAAGFLWLLFVRRFDRARPEPWWLMLATCVLGGASGELAGFIEHHLRLLTPYLDPDVMQLDQSLAVFPITLLVYTLAVGAVEEGTKLLATWSLAMHRREFDEPVDGMLYAAAAAIGFAVDENIGYFANYRLSGGLVASRSLDCIAGHTMLAAIWGYALGKRLVARGREAAASPRAQTREAKKSGRRRARVLPYFALAALIHGAMDTSIVYHVPHASILFIVILMTLFFLLLRNALRWGSVDEVRDEAPPSARRVLFRTGGGAPLAAALVGMYSFGTLLLYAGRVVDADHRRVSLALLVLTAFLLVFLGVAAYGVARSIPLDVAVDDLGVTFAGSLRRWAGIKDITRASKSVLVLHSKDGDLTLGSATAATVDKLESTIRDRLTTKTPDKEEEASELAR